MCRRLVTGPFVSQRQELVLAKQKDTLNLWKERANIDKGSVTAWRISRESAEAVSEKGHWGQDPERCQKEALVCVQERGAPDRNAQGQAP